MACCAPSGDASSGQGRNALTVTWQRVSHLTGADCQVRMFPMRCSERWDPREILYRSDSYDGPTLARTIELHN